MMVRECCFRVILRPKSILVDKKMWLWLSRVVMIEYIIRESTNLKQSYKRKSVSLSERELHMVLGAITRSTFTMKSLDAVASQPNRSVFTI
jgi:hypothetical protein